MIVLLVVCTELNVNVVFVVAPDTLYAIFFVASIFPTMNDAVSINDFPDNVSVVNLPINVSVVVGRERIPVFEICEIIGVVKVLPVKICAAFNVTTVSVTSGNVIVLFVV